MIFCGEDERRSVAAIMWSCYPSSGQRPHPYQLMQEDFLAYFLPFPALLSREKMVSGGLVSNKFIRFSSRVGQIVGQSLSCG